MGKKCLYCYQEVMGEEDFHPHCSQKFFGTTNPPILDYTLQEMEMLAKQVIETSVAVPGAVSYTHLDVYKRQGNHFYCRFDAFRNL